MTYSIVARDPRTGDMGVAVQSHYFCVGRVVPWAEAGVGAVATQSVVEVSYGPLGLDLMRKGASAAETLSSLVAADQKQAARQVAMIDANGVVATHTGASCIGQAGHRNGGQVSAQANMMEKETVWDAMIEAYSNAQDLVLDERLLLALEAAESEGGDVRGKQSAAILIVSGKRSDAPWNQRLVDLRVDDAESPLIEMRRLVVLNRVVKRLTSVFGSGLLYLPMVEAKDSRVISALEDLKAAQEGMGDNREPSFWASVLLAKIGRIDDARASFEYALETNPRWKLFLQSIVAAGALPADCALLSKG